MITDKCVLCDKFLFAHKKKKNELFCKEKHYNKTYFKSVGTPNNLVFSEQLYSEKYKIVVYENVIDIFEYLSKDEFYFTHHKRISQVSIKVDKNIFRRIPVIFNFQ